MTNLSYSFIQGRKFPIKAWIPEEDIEESAVAQLQNISALPFIHKHVAVMPDVHWGTGATVGSVIACKNAVIPAAVGVDIGCGMMAAMTDLTASDLPDDLRDMRLKIERNIPVGFNAHSTNRVGELWGLEEKGRDVGDSMLDLALRLRDVEDFSPGFSYTEQKVYQQLGTLGGGNHFIEICLDTEDRVWFMLHSGSRNIGKVIADCFITSAKEECAKWHIDLPDSNLAYLPANTKIFNQYVEAVEWAQSYAALNRELMFSLLTKAVEDVMGREITFLEQAINCHHNYISLESHFGENVYVTRKGAVRARKNDLGIIPGSMGAKSFIVRGRGNCDSFHSCSHGAGRKMSRKAARDTFTTDDHVQATAGVECKKDGSVLDETPGAYKDIDQVMNNQKDLVDVVYTLKQILCVKG